MIRAGLLTAALTSLFSCADETLSGYGAAETQWRLIELDGAAFDANAVLEFPKEGTLRGQAPCNSFQGTQSVPYPWFKAEYLTVTRAACPELDQETAFFDALQAMTLAEVGGDTLFLSNEDGRKMVFRAE